MKHFLVLSLVCSATFAARAQSTAFTYQGRLAANGSPYTGFAEMQFAVFGAPTGGVAVAASTPGIAGVNVSGGLFATSLDFGAAAFPGADRWLEIQVRTNLGAFSTLTPRQPLAPTPYALYAHTAGTAGPWGLNGTNAFYNGGNVGVGTATPAARLHIKKDVFGIGRTLALEGVNGAAMTFYPTGFAAGRKGFIGFDSDTTMVIMNEYSGGRIVLGNLEGRVELGNLAESVFATGGEENLRIVRGSVLNNSIDLGSGFAVAHLGLGHYRVTFSTPFASRPSVTATADNNFLLVFVDAVTASSATIHLGDPAENVSVAGNFHFIAVGPR